MFTGDEIVSFCTEVGVSHIVWLPDSTFGPWEETLESARGLQLVRVCREGEAWPLAAGLLVGGKSPLVVMQTTGLFESGDALRNCVFDFQLPLFAVIGARSWLMPDSPDTAKRFALPLLDAWGLDYRLIEKPEDKPLLREHYLACRESNKPGVVLVAEGRM